MRGPAFGKKEVVGELVGAFDALFQSRQAFEHLRQTPLKTTVIGTLTHRVLPL
jgi:hypothetical protein